MAGPCQPPQGSSARSSHVYEFKDLENSYLKKQLADDAAWATDLIIKLIHIGGDDAMRPGIINACEGLAFVKAAKVGLGVTIARGSGFVIRKLDQDRFGSSRWSAPVYFTVSQLGFGVAIGYESVHSVLALMSYSSILQFALGKTVVGTDLGLMTTEGAMGGVPAGAFGRTSHMNVQADNINSVFAYSTAAGLLVNISINGTETSPNKEVNNNLYGEPPLVDVLNGKVDTFREFLPLYRKLVDVGKLALE